MTPDCLETLVKTLDENTDCDLCQCKLSYIDENSVPLPEDQQWSVRASKYLHDLLDRPHKRYAPHDGVLHFALMVYTSLTQLLIRKQLFDNIGYFKTGWGSMADFEWGMRASLLYNTVYVPKVLATWRKHPFQATNDAYSSKKRPTILKMTRHAFDFALQHDREKVKTISYSELSLSYKKETIHQEISHIKGLNLKISYFFTCLVKQPSVTLLYVIDRFFNRKWRDKNRSMNWVTEMMKKYNIVRPIVIYHKHKLSNYI